MADFYGFDCNQQKNSGLCNYVTSVYKTSAVHKDNDFRNRQLFKLITAVENERTHNLITTGTRLYILCAPFELVTHEMFRYLLSCELIREIR